MAESGEKGQAPTQGAPPKMIWPFMLVAVAGVLLIELIPVLNTILMVFGAVFWTGLAMNALLVAFAYDAMRGAMPRFLVILPAAVYAANLGFSVASIVEYRAEDTRMNRANAAQTLAFDPMREALVGPDEVVKALAPRYALPGAFTAETTSAHRKQQFYRVLPKADCDRIKNSSDNSRSKSSIIIDGAFVSNACLLAIPGAPVLPAVVLTHETWPSPTSSGLDEITRTMIVAPDGRRAVIEQGRGGVLPPIPMPQIFCIYWEDWNCGAQFFRWPVDLGRAAGRVGVWTGANEAAWVARVLALEPRALGRRIDSTHITLDETEIRRLATASETMVIKGETFVSLGDQFAIFARVLDGASRNGEVLDPWIIGSNAERVTARQAGQIIEALERVRDDPGLSSWRGQLAMIAGDLPPRTFGPIAERLVKAVEADRDLARQENLVIRIGDAGASSVPVLMRLATAEEGQRWPAILGLCRAGPAAAGEADRLLQTVLDPPGRRDQKQEEIQAAVVALARMGRADLAARLALVTAEEPTSSLRTNPASRREARKWQKRLAAVVTPASTANSCSLPRTSDRPRRDLRWLTY